MSIDGLNWRLVCILGLCRGSFPAEWLVLALLAGKCFKTFDRPDALMGRKQQAQDILFDKNLQCLYTDSYIYTTTQG